MIQFFPILLFLHVLFDILLLETVPLYLLFIFIYISKNAWILIYHYLFLWSIVQDLVSGSPSNYFLVPFDMFPLPFKHFLPYWHTHIQRYSNFNLNFRYTCSEIRHFSKDPLFLFSKEYLETTIWVIGMLIIITVYSSGSSLWI